MPRQTDPAELDPSAEGAADFGVRFRQFAESEHQRLLKAAYLIGAALFVLALLGEHFAFGQRFGAEDFVAACGFVLAQMAVLGWRMQQGRPTLEANSRAVLIVANGWMWALLSAAHTLPADTAPYIYECVLVQIVFCYFFSGLVQRTAIISGMLIGAALPLLLLLEGSAPAGAVARGGFVLLAVNCVGAAGRWWIEENQRAQFATQMMLRSQALTDPLTGLCNRRGLQLGLQAALHIAHHDGQHIGIAMLDVDKLKPINDRYGHATGDELLREVAQRLRSVARRSNDTVARLGGDEFVVIWAARSIPDLYLLAERLRAVCESIVLKSAWNPQQTVETSASLGVLLIRKPHGDLSVPKILDRADGLSMMVKRIGGHGMIIREWAEAPQARRADAQTAPQRMEREPSPPAMDHAA